MTETPKPDKSASPSMKDTLNRGFAASTAVGHGRRNRGKENSRQKNRGKEIHTHSGAKQVRTLAIFLFIAFILFGIIKNHINARSAHTEKAPPPPSFSKREQPENF